MSVSVAVGKTFKTVLRVRSPTVPFKRQKSTYSTTEVTTPPTMSVNSPV